MLLRGLPVDGGYLAALGLCGEVGIRPDPLYLFAVAAAVLRYRLVHLALLSVRLFPSRSVPSGRTPPLLLAESPRGGRSSRATRPLAEVNTQRVKGSSVSASCPIGSLGSSSALVSYTSTVMP